MDQRARREGPAEELVPLSAEGTLVYPGVQGGTNWYSPAYSPRTGLFYIPDMG